MKALLLALLLSVTPAYAGDSRALNPTNDPAISEWFQALRQPDQPRVSCCGEADAFEADEWVEDDKGAYMAIITDGRGVLPNGTAVRIPKEKHFDHNPRNPTGHGIVFLHIITAKEAAEDELDAQSPYGVESAGRILVYCYVEPQGA